MTIKTEEKFFSYYKFLIEVNKLISNFDGAHWTIRSSLHTTFLKMRESIEFNFSLHEGWVEVTKSRANSIIQFSWFVTKIGQSQRFQTFRTLAPLTRNKFLSLTKHLIGASPAMWREEEKKTYTNWFKLLPEMYFCGTECIQTARGSDSFTFQSFITLRYHKSTNWRLSSSAQWSELKEKRARREREREENTKNFFHQTITTLWIPIRFYKYKYISGIYSFSESNGSKLLLCLEFRIASIRYSGNEEHKATTITTTVKKRWTDERIVGARTRHECVVLGCLFVFLCCCFSSD